MQSRSFLLDTASHGWPLYSGRVLCFLFHARKDSCNLFPLPHIFLTYQITWSQFSSFLPCVSKISGCPLGATKWHINLTWDFYFGCLLLCLLAINVVKRDAKRIRICENRKEKFLCLTAIFPMSDIKSNFRPGKCKSAIETCHCSPSIC